MVAANLLINPHKIVITFNLDLTEICAFKRLRGCGKYNSKHGAVRLYLTLCSWKKMTQHDSVYAAAFQGSRQKKNTEVNQRLYMAAFTELICCYNLRVDQEAFRISCRGTDKSVPN